MTCLDWLGAALSDLAGRDLPSHLRVDEDGAPRVIAHPKTFDGFMDRRSARWRGIARRT